MPITKTGIEVDTTPQFTNPTIFEVNGQANSVTATGLDPSTRYYSRAYVTFNGNNIYSSNTMGFTTEASYFYIKNEYGGQNTISFMRRSRETNIVTLEYSTDEGDTWTEWTYSGSDLDIALEDGERVLFRGDNTAIGGSSLLRGYWFRGNFPHSVGGNIMSLVDKTMQSTTIPSDCCFAFLFTYDYQLYDITNLKLPATTLTKACYCQMFDTNPITSIPQGFLPATTLAEACYDGMFLNDSLLVNVPYNLLPATTLAKLCYSSMFNGCTSLEVAPDLPATTLAESCYSGMFRSCSSLVNAPALPATTLSKNCYRIMFSSCSSLENVPDLPATTLADGCYEMMFRYCTSLRSTPVIYATTLAESSCSQMFANCSRLDRAIDLRATTLAEKCCYRMFINCYSLVTPPALPATTLADSCYDGMFMSCTSLEVAPDLPATTLKPNCYYYMLNSCSNLKSIKIYARDISATDCTNYWVAGVNATGDFYNLGGAQFQIGNSGIPSGWTEHNSI